MAGTYCNPLPIQGIGDPFVLRASDGRYYLYATSAPDGFLCWASDDLVHWDPQGPCYTAGPEDWGLRDFWAPEGYEIDGRFYLFYSAHNKDNPTNEEENYCLGVAVARRPHRSLPGRDAGRTAPTAGLPHHRRRPSAGRSGPGATRRGGQFHPVLLPLLLQAQGRPL